MISNNPKLFDLEVKLADEDAERYAAPGWVRYNERALLALDARTLMRWEASIGAPLTDVMNGIREDSVFGDTCAAWIALRMAGLGPEEFVDFAPAIMLSQWRPTPAAEDGPGKAPAPTPEPARASGPDSPPLVLTPEVLRGSGSTPLAE